MTDPKAGRELDREIATKIMGWTPVDAKYLTQLMSPPREWGNRGTGFVWFCGTRACEVPHFSTWIADAWLVEEEIARRNLRDPYGDALVQIATSGWEYFDPTDAFALAHASPLDRCLAALRAVESARGEPK